MTSWLFFYLKGAPSSQENVKEHFDDLKGYITDSLEKMKFYTKSIIQTEKLSELSVTAQAVLYELSVKLTFMEKYMSENMTDKVLLEVKDELDVFEHGTETSKMRIAYDTYCHNPKL